MTEAETYANFVFQGVSQDLELVSLRSKWPAVVVGVIVTPAGAGVGFWAGTPIGAVVGGLVGFGFGYGAYAVVEYILGGARPVAQDYESIRRNYLATRGQPGDVLDLETLCNLRRNCMTAASLS